ncbi:uncharacterized protein LOC135334492 isoform X2 [Halichondria panicea]|uniref:uncharacterized protein LOC135334492 isoform X2 n=1 Tax=Halichondria panicea TaxID=6063 RepID=UPI00312B3B6B
MYKLIACIVILSALSQESVQDGNCPDCPDCPVCRAPTAEASITSTFAGSFSKTRRRRQAATYSEPDSNAPTTRGNEFALAFMKNTVERAEITLYITTEQNVSNFTIETKFSGLIGFNETSPDSGLYCRTGTARRGEYTIIQLQAGGDSNGLLPDLSVRSDGDSDTSDRQKGLNLTADNQNDELTIYALSSDDNMTSADAFMAINCVALFPTATNYQYFVFSSYTSLNNAIGTSQFLVTPCQNNTTIHVRPSQQHTHPSWVNSTEEFTFTGTETSYQRPFNRFDTLMLSNPNDLTGTIITSNKPLSVFSGTCGTSNTMIYLVEQVPPHPTYGDRFLLAPFDLQPRVLPNYLPMNIDIYRIGSVSDEVSIQVNCPCEPIPLFSNRVPLSGSGSSFTAIINRGQFVECAAPVNNRTFCSIESTRPVTVMSYHFGLFQNRQNLQDTLLSSWLMVYTPPTESYLTRYSLPSLPNDLSLSYFQESEHVLITPGLLVNGNASIVSDLYTPINCSELCSGPFLCGRGATRLIGLNETNSVKSLQFSGNTPFWGYAYGFSPELSIAYSLPFGMRPIGLAWIEAQNITVLENVDLAGMEFMITRGDRSVMTRAFAVTRNLTATEGNDFNSTQGTTDSSNLVWRAGNSAPNVRFTVPIINDDIPEPNEVLEIEIRCEDNGNCYIPQQIYTITIIDDQALCPTLSQIDNGTLIFNSDSPDGSRTNGTVALYSCSDGFMLDGLDNRTCFNGVWNGEEDPMCIAIFCSNLSQFDNGTLIRYDMELLNGTRPNGTVARYTCMDMDRFMLVGDANRTCDTGNWTGTAPVCIKTFCPDDLPEDIDNGALQGYEPGPLNGTRLNGTVATYTCNFGYSLLGDVTRTCDTGNWTSNAPLCTLSLGSIIAIYSVSVLTCLVISCSPCICVCVCYARLRRYKKKRPRVSTIRIRKLSDRSNLMDYQMREIVKYVPESMRIPSSNLKLHDAVGQGAFGIVYKGLLMDWNNVSIRGVALKTLKGLFTLSDVQSMVSEITKMQEFHHPHVMSLIGVCLDAGPGVSMVMPYMTNGSLLDYLKKERSTLELAKGEDSEKVLAARKLLLKMCHQIALGMVYLAQHKFIHRDLAARNCMLDSNGDLKVGDFGLAEDTYAQGYFRQNEAEGVKLPYKWMAMESLNDAIFCEKTDVWSYGVTVWEVFSSGRTPYPGVDPMSLVALLREGKRLEPPQNIACSTEIVSLMTRCWYEDYEERPCFDELAAELEKVLSTMVGYVELNMELVAITEDEHKYDHVLSPEEQRKIAETATEEVVIEKNAAYGLRSEDQLQARQLTMETKLAYELRRESELPKNPAEQVTESDDYFNSDPHSPLLEPVDTTGYASVPHRRSSSSSFS